MCFLQYALNSVMTSNVTKSIRDDMGHSLATFHLAALNQGGSLSNPFVRCDITVSSDNDGKKKRGRLLRKQAPP